MKHPRRLGPYFYGYGLKARLPFGLLHGVAEAAERSAHLAEIARRRAAARRLLEDSRWRGFVPREKASRLFDAGAVPGLDRLVEIGGEVRERHRAAADTGAKLTKRNPFQMHLSAQNFADHPEILEVALSRPLVEIVSDYFGAVPKLAYADLWVTPADPPEKPLFDSQLFHLDKPHFGIATLFVNVGDVGPDNGPVTFLPADVSRKVWRRTDYGRRYYLADGRLADAEVEAVAPEDTWQRLIGPSGTGAFVDTTKCMHFGSRCRRDERVMFVLRYVPGHRDWDFLAHRHVPAAADPHLAALVLGAAPAAP